MPFDAPAAADTLAYWHACLSCILWTARGVSSLVRMTCLANLRPVRQNSKRGSCSVPRTLSCGHFRPFPKLAVVDQAAQVPIETEVL